MNRKKIIQKQEEKYSECVVNEALNQKTSI